MDKKEYVTKNEVIEITRKFEQIVEERLMAFLGDEELCKEHEGKSADEIRGSLLEKYPELLSEIRNGISAQLGIDLGSFMHTSEGKEETL